MSYAPYTGGGGSGSISASTDVALNNPQNTEALEYDATTQKWVNTGRLSETTLTSTYVASPGIRTILQVTQAEYDALTPPDPATLYVVVG